MQTSDEVSSSFSSAYDRSGGGEVVEREAFEATMRCACRAYDAQCTGFVSSMQLRTALASCCVSSEQTRAIMHIADSSKSDDDDDDDDKINYEGESVICSGELGVNKE